MTSHVLTIGRGVLADMLCQLLDSKNLCTVTRAPEMPSEMPPDIDLALVLDDSWPPAVHSTAEDTFRAVEVPWLRGFVMFGIGVVGPIVFSDQAGCSHCADLRLLMAEVDRLEMLQFKTQFAIRDRGKPDVWATRTGLLQMAHILVGQLDRALRDIDTCHVVNHVFCTNLKTLDTTRHFILPNAACPVCGWLPEDTSDRAVIELKSSPKVNEHSFRSRSFSDFKNKLVADYFDEGSGLFNGRVHDLITPFAAVSVNLPLLLGDEGTSGRSHSYEECEPIAILEGLERYCGLEPRGKRTAVYDTYTNLKDVALNPVTVGLHHPAQYDEPDFPFQVFDKDTAMEWVWGYSLHDHRPILVPQRLAYYSLGSPDGFVYETSNGCAIGSTLVEAIFHGILEIVERDAFLLTWYAQLPLPAIDLTVNTDRELQWMIERIRLVTGYDLHAYNATMENGIPTVFVIAKNRRPHGLNLLCSAGSHLDPMRAIKAAIQETAGMLIRLDEQLDAKRDAYLQMLHHPSQVRHMEHHSMLYGLPEAMDRLAFLLDGPRPFQTLEQAFPSHAAKPHMDLADDLKDVLRVFHRLHLDVIVVNQTSPEIERNGIHCVKVLIPGMLPMTFGHHLTRLEHLERVLTVPMELGYTKQRLTREELNPHPHPFP